MDLGANTNFKLVLLSFLSQKIIEALETMTTENFTWNLDKATIEGKIWKTSNAPKGVVALVHGFFEHIARYQHVAEYFDQHDIALVGYDQRGHGKSSGKRGHVKKYEWLLEDVERLIQKAQEVFPNTPVVLYGHSWGGNIVTNYLLKRDTSKLAGAVVSSPWLKLATDPPKFQVALGKFVGKLFPGFTQTGPLNEADLSTDLSVGKAYKADPLIHNKISVATFLSTIEAGLWALDNAQKLQLDTLLMHGDDDNITSHTASQAFAQKAPEKVTLQIWEGMRHETHNEVKKEEVLKKVTEWIVGKVTS